MMNTSIIPIIGGWQETLVSVANLDTWVQFYTLFENWELLYTGKVSADRLSFLGLDATSGAREAIVGRIDSTFGQVRLVEFADTPGSRLIRPSRDPRDTGGWFDLNARVANMADSHQHFLSLGWQGISEPVQYEFGPFTVKEWVAFGPDGVALAMMERIHPPLEAHLHPGAFGRHFNSTQIVDDIGQTRHFYREVLGFESILDIDDETMSPEPGPNVLGLPPEVAAKQRWSISMLRAPGEEGGTVEMIALHGAQGNSFADQTDPPNRGIISHRFPVDDLDALHAHLVNADIPIINGPVELRLPPHDSLRILTARGPCGVRLDFYESA